MSHSSARPAPGVDISNTPAPVFRGPRPPGGIREVWLPSSRSNRPPEGGTVAPQSVSQSSTAPPLPPELPLRVGITTPVLTLLPGGHASWEVDAGIDEVATVASTAEALGYYHLTCSEHVVIPAEAAPVWGSRYWDPLATFGFLAAVTS